MHIQHIGGHTLLSQTQAPQHTASSPLLEQGNRLFEQSVRRGPLHFQSSDLKHLITELRQLQSVPNSAQAQRVQDAIQHWENHHPKEVAARSSRLAELKQALAEQGAVVRTLQPKVMAAGPQAMLQQAMPALQKMGTYACTDAGTFVSKQNSHYQQIMERLRLFNDSPDRLRGNSQANMMSNMAAIAARQGNVSFNQLQSIAARVAQAQAGCCTTLAYSAAAELMKHNQNDQQRIEVVAHRGAKGHSQTHCFVVVGRDPNSELSKPETWGSQAYVIDPWAATIGGKLQGTSSNPPIANLWPPTESVFDNHKR
ncbi:MULTISPECIES: hypothetical protein [unclassified Photorhabdus]|uniref:hypothetical protein n=1 Tax=unclassified Photorhabdus TaxID=2620880 RepID=UPI000DCBA4BC|nr:MULTISPECIES: hypothetical protein [unclassified Photorhabdus]RAW95241.1 hypothetical protein CKY03_18040 [Photorhabdus sp. S9-53]RAW95408.1 hypothetical protein CKY05_17830 [Photorhabdus sp. S10-54]RAW97097.1 hypothetical protein CKY04_21740 [Photorhabdus sp. S8-52]